jgi:uncharacterized protein
MRGITMYGTETVADAPAVERAEFIRKTYTLVAGAILAFIGLEWLLFQTPWPVQSCAVLAQSRYYWLIVLGAFLAVSNLADRWAKSASSIRIQYFGLGVYVVAEALIFMPLLYLASVFASEEVIPMAALLTLMLFGALTYTAFTTMADFTFLDGVLKMGYFMALGIIGAGIVFGFSLGLWFSSAMVAIASGSILYTTSRILRQYQSRQHVAAALSLFASIALLFWYVLRILMSLNSRN